MLCRYYYIFRRPITTDPSMTKDKEKCDALYSMVKSEVQEGLQYLIESRQDDPYGDFAKRLVYEATQRKQAPTFIP